VAKYGKQYASTEEYEKRKQLFAETHEKIMQINESNGTSQADHN